MNFLKRYVVLVDLGAQANMDKIFEPTHVAIRNISSRVLIGNAVQHIGDNNYLTEDGYIVQLKPEDVVYHPFGKSEMVLPTDAQERKQIPITTGVLDYFPLAIAEVAKCSWAGNQQHHPDKELHWDKTKSTDHADCIARHLVDRGKFDTDGQRHSAKLAWRALALLQLELEEESKKGNSITILSISAFALGSESTSKTDNPFSSASSYTLRFVVN